MRGLPIRQARGAAKAREIADAALLKLTDRVRELLASALPPAPPPDR